MNTIKLFPFQHEAIKCLSDAHGKRKRILLSLPTGTGKTLVAARYIKSHFLDKNKRVVWIAQTQELLDQAYETFTKKIGIEPKRIGRSYAKNKDKFYEFNDIWLCNSGNSYFPGFHPALIVFDEAHHAAAKGHRDILSMYKAYKKNGSRVLGLTATPYRMEKGEVKDLTTFKFSSPKKPIFQKIAYRRSFCELAREGHVAPFDHVISHTNLTFKMQMNKGKFTYPSLEQLNTPERNQFIYDMWYKNRKKYGKTLIFVGTREHAIELSEFFGKHGEYVISGDDDCDRVGAVERFRRGKTNVLVNVAMFKEGFDVPDIKTVILARPTMSPLLFTQMVGRGSRILPNKKFFYLIDIHDQLGKHERYLAGVSDLSDRDDNLLIEVITRARSMRNLEEGWYQRRLIHDPMVLMEILTSHAGQIYKKYEAWVVFKDRYGEQQPVGTFLSKDEYRLIKRHLDKYNQLLPCARKRLDKSKKRSAGLMKCRAALSEGLIGTVYDIIILSLDEIEELCETARIAMDLVDTKRAKDVKSYIYRINERARKWEIKSSEIGMLQSQCLHHAYDDYSVMLLKNTDGACFLQWIPNDVVDTISHAFFLKKDQKLSFNDGPRILREIENVEPDLSVHGSKILDAIKTASSIDDCCIVR